MTTRTDKRGRVWREDRPGFWVNNAGGRRYGPMVAVVRRLVDGWSWMTALSTKYGYPTAAAAMDAAGGDDNNGGDK